MIGQDSDRNPDRIKDLQAYLPDEIVFNKVIKKLSVYTSRTEGIGIQTFLRALNPELF